MGSIKVKEDKNKCTTLYGMDKRETNKKIDATHTMEWIRVKAD